jgi:hypothetical protein
MRKQGVDKSDRRRLAVWIPRHLAPLLARGVKSAGTDKSKFVRLAIREKLARHDISIPDDFST